jgi:selenophosphate synthetase-related protein
MQSTRPGNDEVMIALGDDPGAIQFDNEVLLFF